VLYYQPKLDLAAGTVRAVEALVRWQHPTYGLLGPDRFLGLAEHTGLIDALTMEVLDQALTQQATWRRDGLDLDVAVNISVTNLRDEGLPGKIEEALRRRGVAPARLTIEITETSLMADPSLAIKILGQLQQLGARVSVDDYGTGFASLAYLRSLPINELKLDRSFLAGIPGDGKALSIVRSTIELAHTLGLRIVTEGVETHDVLDLITSLGSDAAQGYFISRPAPAAELVHRLGCRGLIKDHPPAAQPRQIAPAPRGGRPVGNHRISPETLLRADLVSSGGSGPRRAACSTTACGILAANLSYSGRVPYLVVATSRGAERARTSASAWPTPTGRSSRYPWPYSQPRDTS
jgi:EAL domain-containing protein (putative c-di-GMP-specific phosphodiesterase class I)